MALPEIVGHRGSREGVYEHTFGAFRQAIADGADALECDIRLTADGHLVCLHDRRLEFVSGQRGIVSTMTLEELRAVRFGARRPWRPVDRYRGGRPVAPPVDADPEATRLTTLRELLELVADAGRPVGLLIEIKHPTRYGGRVEARLAELLTEFGLDRRIVHPDGRPAVRVMSFAEVASRRMRRLTPELDLVHLMARLPRRYRDGSLPDGVGWAGISKDIVRTDPGYVARAHARGHRVNVWTVNEPEDVARCLAAGVDTITTDRPRAVREQVFAAR
ncbi:glycerophosphodiester phosphodiesterase [Sporichthya brevicatena]|uniref:Glycerophosphodiester phosphodiesterase n=1 Tax=Sporichthya brevicatena TaxID=171442 RepID=A0ABP3SFA7_9ACTN